MNSKKIIDFLKKYYNYILFILVAGITCYFIYKQVNFREFYNILKHSKGGYILAAVLTLVLYWVMEAGMLLVLIRFEYPQESFRHAFTLMMIGQYYNQVTPSSSGGQPLQLIDMVSTGVSPGFGTAVLVQKYALYQISVTLIGIIGVLSNLKLIFTWIPLGRIMLYIGLAINLAGSILIIVIALNPKFAKVLLNFLVRTGLKFHIIKDEKKWYGRVQNFLDEYESAILGLKDHIFITIGLLLFNLLAILVYYLITYLIYRGLGLSTLSVFRVILIQSVLYLMIAFVPLPGAAGGAEIGFAIVFGTIFGATVSSVALITWRIITFYLILIVGGIYCGVHSLLLTKYPPKKLLPKDANNRYETHKESS